MPTLNRDLLIVFRIVASCLTSGLLIFFISAFSGEDLLKNHSAIKDLDKILGEMLARLPEDATVLLMSDHGFDAIYRQVNMANWLPDTDLPAWLATHAIPSMSITNGILHYTLDGKLSGSSDREAFIDKFQEMCAGLQDPQTGVCPFETVDRREDLYEGRMVEKAPDVIFQEAPKYFVTRGVPDSVGVPVFQNVWTTSFSAYHRPHGVLALRGPQVKGPQAGSLRERLERGGDFEAASILDVMPTLLDVAGAPVPETVDGASVMPLARGEKRRKVVEASSHVHPIGLSE